MVSLTLATAIERRFENSADALALIDQAGMITWGELAAATRRTAALLAGAGAARGDRVIVCMQRGRALPAAVYAVHLLGATCVPIDPDDPTERFAALIRASGARYCLTEDDGVAVPSDVVVIDVATRATAEPLQSHATQGHGSDDDAFIFFTSGTTGVPKGVVLSDSAVVSGQTWLQQTFDATPADRMLLRSSISLTNLVRELYWPVLSGAAMVVLAPGEHRDPASHVAAIKAHGVTIFLAVPSLLRAMANVPEMCRCSSLRLVFGSSDAMPVNLPTKLHAVLPETTELYNLYGLTEALYAGFYHCRRGELYTDAVPAGNDAELSMLLLDEAGRGVPPGELGHLILVGNGIASGYLDLPKLTEEKFARLPSRPAFDRTFRTGDLAQRNAEGLVVLAGRSDDMVKVRGYRVETGEVAGHLRSFLEISDAAVVGMDDGDGSQRLVAFLEFAPGAALDAGELRERLESVLPTYMLPSAFARVDRIPLTHNGKVDLRVLREQAIDYIELNSVYAKPRTEAERRLITIWADVLKQPAETIGIHDDFFGLGGDSIAGFLVSARLNSLGRSLSATQVFATPTIAEMAVVLEAAPAVAIGDHVRDGTQNHTIFGWDQATAARILKTIKA